MIDTKPDKGLNRQLIIIHILLSLLALSPLLYMLGLFIVYKEPTTKVIQSLICSDVVIVENQDYLHTTFGGMWEFPSGSYTPKQGEVCVVGHKEVQK